MFAALLVTAAAALIVVESRALQSLIFSHEYVFYGLIIAEVVLVLGISAGMKRMSSAVANVLFFFFAILNGLTISVIFFAFDIGTIFQAFSISALMFAAMAVFGAVTKRDLSSVGSFCIMGLFGIIIASIANIFLRSDMIDFLVCYIGVLVFVGLTAYDTQRIRRSLRDAHGMGQVEALRKISVYGALSLYLNFINLFLKILRIFARRR